jgi:hypothetical protein
VANQTFHADVDKWVTATKARMLAVFKKSCEVVINTMQITVNEGGNMPIDTGFLRASLLATLNAPTNKVTFRDSDVGVHTWSSEQVTLVILSAKLGDSVYAIYTANYAGFQEYGSQGRAGRGFVRLAAQRWPRIVDDVVRQYRNRAAGSLKK